MLAGNRAVDGKNHQCLRRARSARNLHRGNIYAGIPEYRADMSDHTRNVFVARNDPCALRNCVELVIVDLYDSRTTRNNRGCDSMSAGKNRHQRRERRRLRFMDNVYGYAYLLRDLLRVDDRNAALRSRLKQRGEKRGEKRSRICAGDLTGNVQPQRYA